MKKIMFILIMFLMLFSITGCFTTSHTVTFDSEGGSYVNPITVKNGKTITEPTPPTKYGYEFEGWYYQDELFSFEEKIVDDITLEAKWKLIEIEIKEFTVTFKDYDGTVLKEEKVEEGKSATAPNGPTREGYNFIGWNKEFNNITSNIVVIAQYEKIVVEEKIEYTVKFIDYDGTILKQVIIEKGERITAPTAPIREGYTFKGWDKSFVDVSSDLIISAVYEQNKYTVIFKDYDGSILDEQIIVEGKSAIAPIDPTREGYTFKGWDKKFDVVMSNLNVTAMYQKNEVIINEFIVIFKDYDGTVLKEEIVEKGKEATAPTEPTRRGYIFKGWDKEFTNITSDITVTAVYEEIVKYTVTFKDHDGSILDEQIIEEGKSATAPTDPTREGYTFKGWDKEFTNITSDITVTAVYEEIVKYTVTFKDHDGSILDEQIIEEGKNAISPTDPTREGYTFKGWDKEFTNITSDITVTAVYEEIVKYTVTFKDHDGSILDEQIIEEGKSAISPTDPTRDGYIFKGWDTDFSNVTSDLIVTATYISEGSSYIINYVLDGGTNDINNINSISSNDSDFTLLPALKDGYQFMGWYLESTFETKIEVINNTLTEDITLYAKYIEVEYIANTIHINGYNTQSATTNFAMYCGIFLYQSGKSIGSSLYWHKVAITKSDGKYIVSAIAKSGEATPSSYDYLILSYSGTDNTTAYKSLVDSGLVVGDEVKFSLELGSLSSGSVDLDMYVYCDAITYSNLTLVANGGTVTYSNVYNNQEEYVLPIPEKVGHTFDGWYETSDFSGNAITTIPVGTVGDKTYYALWYENVTEGLWSYISNPVTSATKDVLPNTIDSSTVTWESSDTNLYVIDNGYGYTQRLYQTHKKQTVVITATVLTSNSEEVHTNEITINPVLYDDMEHPGAVYFAVSSTTSYTNNNERYKTEGTMFSEKFRENMDMIYYAFAVPQSDGTLTLDTKYIDTVKALKNDGIRVLLVIDGANRTPLQAMVQLCNDDTTRAVFVKNIIDMITKYNFDGVDVDWEFPGTSGLDGFTTEIDQVNLNKLLRDLRTGLNNVQDSGGSNYILSVAIPATSWGSVRYDYDGNSELGGIDDYCDYVNMMSYDLNHTSYTTHLSSHYSSTISNDYKFGCVYGTERFVSLGLSRNKIILGTAAYGKAYQVTGTVDLTATYPGLNVAATLTQISGVTGSYASGTIYYTGIQELLATEGYVKYTEMNGGNIVGSYIFNSSNNIYITYDSAEAVKAKCEYANSYDGMGVMVWAYGEDATDTVVNTICDTLGK